MLPGPLPGHGRPANAETDPPPHGQRVWGVRRGGDWLLTRGPPSEPGRSARRPRPQPGDGDHHHEQDYPRMRPTWDQRHEAVRGIKGYAACSSVLPAPRTTSTTVRGKGRSRRGPASSTSAHITNLTGPALPRSSVSSLARSKGTHHRRRRPRAGAFPVPVARTSSATPTASASQVAPRAARQRLPSTCGRN